MKKTPTVTAHTGCMGTKMNSLESIISGIENGCDIVEFDLNFDKNNNAVLSHNPPEGGEVTLDEAFALLKKYNDIKANVDVKNTSGIIQAEKLADKYDITERIFFTGVELKHVPAVKKCKKISYYLNIEISSKNEADNPDFQNKILEYVKETGAAGVNVNYSNVTASFIKFMHKNNIPVSGWTAETKEVTELMLGLDFDNITTKRPDILKDLLKNRCDKMEYEKMNTEEQKELYSQLKEKYNKICSQNLSLDMSRGKPNKVQLDLSNGMFDVLNSGSDFKDKDGIETRNYGGPFGINECIKLFADLMEVNEKNVIIFGNASLTIMYDYIAQCMLFGCGDEPWCRQGKIKFLCPVPGYDRHFGILEHFGIEMINVKMTENGPDMDEVEKYIKDEKVKGLICVPKYSNPDGITFSKETVERFARLSPAAKDFRVIWDNAYLIHDFNDTPDKLENIFDYAYKNGTQDYFIEVCSTSKISLPGAGVSALAASEKNIEQIKNRMKIQIISHDKINQLRHVRYFKNLDGIKSQMKKHAEIIRPKFNIVLDCLEKELGGTGTAKWKKPNGGYFISLFVMNGCAKRVGQLCKEAGLTLTAVGATYPYGKDPDDSNIRIAPTFPDEEELKKAVDLLCICVKMAALEKLIK